MSPSIVVLDAAPLDAGDVSWERIEVLGSLRLHGSTQPGEIAERCADADIVLTNKVPVNAAMLGAAASRVRLVSVLATGRDKVDLGDLDGVTVCNVPAYATAATAQLTVALLLEIANGVGAHAAAVASGAWAAAPSFAMWLTPQQELEGRVFGVVGRGAIGRRVACIVEALGMRVVFVAPPGRPAESPRVGWDEGIRSVDVLSLHCPLNATTRHMVDAAVLAAMRPGAWLLNTARGGLVDEAAVSVALRDGRLGGYGADVLSTEPPRDGSPLLGAPNAFITPHMAWATRAARQRLIDTTAENIAAFLAGRPIHVVPPHP